MIDGNVRVPPLDPADFSPEQAELVGDWTHLVFSRVIVRHPGAYRNFVPHIRALIAESTLPPRDREIVVLRILALCDESYELHHHRMIAAANSGMGPEEIEAAIAGGGDCLSDFDRLLVAAAEELLSARELGDESWESLGERYSIEQRMELVFLAGLYVTMAMLTKSFGMPLESEGQDFEKIQALREYD